TPRFSADGKILLTCCAETHCTWDLTPVLARHPGAGFPTPTSERTKNAWESLVDEYSPGGRLVLRCDRSGNGGKVEVLDTATGKPVSPLEGAKGANIALLPADGSCAALWDWSQYTEPIEAVRFYNARTGKKANAFKPDENRLIFGPALSPD